MDVAVRTAAEADVPVLRETFLSARAGEVAALPWSDEEKAAFLDHQFVQQLRSYREMHPNASFLVVLVDDVPMGRLFLADVDDSVRILDIALLPAWRGRGIGTLVLQHVLAEARARGRGVSLHVEQWNPARALYERLGFEACDGDNPMYVRMEAPAAAHADATAAVS